jgi:transcriptional regulator with XRE-family HTH domain
VKERESHWKGLRARLSRAVSAYGAKSSLAREFNVTPASVSEWLSGESSPTAETTLRLLHWVEQYEAQPKESSGGALTPPEPKTQVRKSGYDKQTQVRKKK